MKRIIAALICVSMCCIFSFPAFSAEIELESNFDISKLEFVSLAYVEGGNLITVSVDSVSNTSNQSVAVYYNRSLSGTGTNILSYNVIGTWSNGSEFPDPEKSEVESSYLSFVYQTNVNVLNNDYSKLYYYNSEGQLVTVPFNYAVVINDGWTIQVTYNVNNAVIYKLLTESVQLKFDVSFNQRLITSPSNGQYEPFITAIIDIFYHLNYNPVLTTDEKIDIIIGNQDDMKSIISDLPDNIASKIKNVDLGTVETASIPYDQLEDMQDIENQLYDYHSIIERYCNKLAF